MGSAVLLHTGMRRLSWAVTRAGVHYFADRDGRDAFTLDPQHGTATAAERWWEKPPYVALVPACEGDSVAAIAAGWIVHELASDRPVVTLGSAHDLATTGDLLLAYERTSGEVRVFSWPAGAELRRFALAPAAAAREGEDTTAHDGRWLAVSTAGVVLASPFAGGEVVELAAGTLAEVARHRVADPVLAVAATPTDLVVQTTRGLLRREGGQLVHLPLLARAGRLRRGGSRCLVVTADGFYLVPRATERPLFARVEGRRTLRVAGDALVLEGEHDVGFVPLSAFDAVPEDGRITADVKELGLGAAATLEGRVEFSGRTMVRVDLAGFGGGMPALPVSTSGVSVGDVARVGGYFDGERFVPLGFEDQRGRFHPTGPVRVPTSPAHLATVPTTRPAWIQALVDARFVADGEGIGRHLDGESPVLALAGALSKEDGAKVGFASYDGKLGGEDLVAELARLLDGEPVRFETLASAFPKIDFRATVDDLTADEHVDLSGPDLAPLVSAMNRWLESAGATRRLFLWDTRTDAWAVIARTPAEVAKLTASGITGLSAP